MQLGRQTMASTAQALAALKDDQAAALMYKHLAIPPDLSRASVLNHVSHLESGSHGAVIDLVKELISEKAAFRTTAPIRHHFDAQCRTLERWLSYDGWLVEQGELVRIGPAAEEASGVRDALIDQLKGGEIDPKGEIRNCIEKAGKAFVQEPPDFNASITNVRISLETIARSAASGRASKGGAPYPNDSWGNALLYLRQANVVELKEEDVLAKIYTFISPGAHVPKGLTEEEWARLARTFGLGAAYFFLRKHLSTS